MEVIGVDFTSRPTPRKPIVAARGKLDGGTLRIGAVLRLTAHADLLALLRAPGPWVAALDFPFGLPRDLVDTLGWPGAGERRQRHWRALVRHFASLNRADVGETFGRFRASRPEGGKYARRGTEAPAGAHPAMKLVNPPVGWMLHEGAPLLLDAGVQVPGLCRGDRERVALEAYPGLLMRQIAGRWGEPRTPPYKNDAPAKRTAAHRDMRVRLLWALVEGEHPLQIRLDLPVGLAAQAVDDASGDTIDALAAAVQAAHGARAGPPRYGLPSRFDPVEGWIVGAARLRLGRGARAGTGKPG